MLPALVLLLGASTLSAQVPATAARYTIDFAHEMRNTSSETLRDVDAYVAVPASDAQQSVDGLRWQAGLAAAAPAFVTDQYGQMLARFTIAVLLPGERACVGFRCEVSLRDPGEPIDGRRVGALADVPAEVRRRFTVDAPAIYDLRAPGVATQARRLIAGCEGLFDRVLSLHDFVAGSVTYERDGGWDPASTVLQRRSGSCSEFSYLFAALCRAVDIPTRFVGASENTTGGECVDRVWHRWVQVYLPPYGWVDVDVTRDRGVPPKREWLARRSARCFVVSYGGGDSTLLGDHYISANSDPARIETERRFAWLPLVGAGVTDAAVK